MKKYLLLSIALASLGLSRADLVTNNFSGLSYELGTNVPTWGDVPYFTFGYQGSNSTGKLDGNYTNRSIQPTGFCLLYYIDPFVTSDRYYLCGYDNSQNQVTTNTSDFSAFLGLESTNYQVLVNSPITNQQVAWFSLPHPTLYSIAPGDLIDASITNGGTSTWNSTAVLDQLMENSPYYAAIRWGDGAGNYNYGYARFSTGPYNTGSSNVSNIYLEQLVSQSTPNEGLRTPASSYDWIFTNGDAPGDVLSSFNKQYPMDRYSISIDRLANINWVRNSYPKNSFTAGLYNDMFIGGGFTSNSINSYYLSSDFLHSETSVDSSVSWIANVFFESISANTVYFRGIRKTESLGNYRYGYIQFTTGVVSEYGSFGGATLSINRIAFATNLNQPITIPALPLGAQTITFGSLPPKTLGDAPFTLLGTASSGLPVSYSSSATNISLSSNVVTILGAGTATIMASQAGDTNYAAATPVSQSLVIAARSLGAQTITFGALPGKTFGDAPFTLLGTASSGLPVSYSSSATNISLSSNVVTILGAGTATIAASQAGDTNYAAATPVSQPLVIARRSQQIDAITSNTPASDILKFMGTNSYGDAPINLIGISSSGLPVVYSSSNTNVAFISNNQLVIVGSGTATIYADQPGNADWGAAPQLSGVLVVGKASPVFPEIDTSVSYATNLRLPLPTTNAIGLPITYANPSTNVGILTNNSLAIRSVGSATITESIQAGVNNIGATNRVVITVAKGTQNFGFEGITNSMPCGSSILLGSTNPSSGLPVIFALAKGSPATLSAKLLKATGVGTVTLFATNAGSSLFQPLLARKAISIVRATQAVSFPLTNSIAKGIAVALNASASSGLAVTYTSSASNVLSIKGTTLTALTNGTATITAVQAGSTNYYPASNALSVRVLSSQKISFTNNLSATYSNGLTLPVSGRSSAGSNYPVAYSSSDSNVISVSGTNLVVRGSGTATITISQAGDGSWLPVTLSTNFVVRSAVPALGNFSFTNVIYAKGLVITPANPSSPSTGSWSFTSSATNVAKVTNANSLTILGSGTTSITARQAASGNYSSNSITATLTVLSSTPVISGLADMTTNFSTNLILLTNVTSQSPGGIAFTSSVTNVATISSNLLTIRGCGTTTISASQKASGGYTAATNTAVLIVQPPVSYQLGTNTLELARAGDPGSILNGDLLNGVDLFQGSTNYAVSDLAKNRAMPGGVLAYGIEKNASAFNGTGTNLPSVRRLIPWNALVAISRRNITWSTNIPNISTLPSLAGINLSKVQGSMYYEWPMYNDFYWNNNKKNAIRIIVLTDGKNVLYVIGNDGSGNPSTYLNVAP